MKTFLVAILFMGFISSCRMGQKHDFELHPLSPFMKLNSFGKIVQKYKYFLLLNKSGGTIPVNLIEQQVKAGLDSNYRSYDNYIVVIYRESPTTNKSYVEKESDIIEWHSNDMLFTFSWERGKYVGVIEYKDGDVKNLDVEVKSLDSVTNR